MYISKKFCTVCYYEKNIRNPKYLFFVLKKELFAFLQGMGYLATHGGGEKRGVCTAHEKFTNNRTNTW